MMLSVVARYILSFPLFPICLSAIENKIDLCEFDGDFMNHCVLFLKAYVGLVGR